MEASTVNAVIAMLVAMVSEKSAADDYFGKCPGYHLFFKRNFLSCLHYCYITIAVDAVKKVAIPFGASDFARVNYDNSCFLCLLVR